MPSYIATAQVFSDRLYEVGDRADFASDPGAPWVLAHLYKPVVERALPVERDSAFVSSSLEVDDRRTRQPGPDRRTHDTHVEHSTPSRLEGRSPHERRY